MIFVNLKTLKRIINIFHSCNDFELLEVKYQFSYLDQNYFQIASISNTSNNPFIK